MAFQRMDANARVRVAEGTPRAAIVVLQTLRRALPITLTISDDCAPEITAAAS